ncbi:competence type IV pilus ATPase ComGA [Halalkalibacillus halophilus]|uniref:competence type IV pilus ATPase ComGA n=1 Tax=Halalkalibacillus halophilus TaxID=392827 RepID=UPI0004106314|nr:competence type IV pilus ATPase ComGA [Halalkalibacillus halophilus]
MNKMEQDSFSTLTEALKRDATDIHFSPGEKDVSIHFRVDGYRLLYRKISIQAYHKLLSYYKFSSGMDIAEQRIPQDGTQPFVWNSTYYDLRLSTLPLPYSESLVIRLLPRTAAPDLNQLFLFPDQADQLLNWIQKPAGIILFTGSTGCGKSTTMYALMREATKKFGLQTISLEDPVEQSVEHILQVQVNEKAGFDYDIGLKAALRHDPDIIMVGEIRDHHTAKFAFRAALTGHLVLSTVHAKNAYGTLDRLKEMGLSTVDLQQSIIGIASQQLVTLLPSEKQKRLKGRAAVCETLTDDYLNRALHGLPINQAKNFTSFDQLRKKAHALGYIHAEL